MAEDVTVVSEPAAVVLPTSVVAHGSHNQKTHGRRGGSSVPATNTTTGGRAYVSEDRTVGPGGAKLPDVAFDKETREGTYGDIEFEDAGHSLYGSFQGWSNWDGNYMARTASAAMMGLDQRPSGGYSHLSDYEHYALVNGKPYLDGARPGDVGVRETQASMMVGRAVTDAYNIHADILANEGTTYDLYRGMAPQADSALNNLKVGDVFDMPLSATTPDVDSATHFGEPFNEGEVRMTMVFEKGTRVAHNQVADMVSDRDGNLRHWESVTGGRFEVTDRVGGTIRVRQVGVFDPDQGAIVASAKKLTVVEWWEFDGFLNAPALVAHGRHNQKSHGRRASGPGEAKIQEAKRMPAGSTLVNESGTMYTRVNTPINGLKWSQNDAATGTYDSRDLITDKNADQIMLLPPKGKPALSASVTEEAVVAHGNHNQKSHGRRGGGGGTVKVGKTGVSEDRHVGPGGGETPEAGYNEGYGSVYYGDIEGSEGSMSLYDAQQNWVAYEGNFRARTASTAMMGLERRPTGGFDQIADTEGYAWTNGKIYKRPVNENTSKNMRDAYAHDERRDAANVMQGVRDATMLHLDALESGAQSRHTLYRGLAGLTGKEAIANMKPGDVFDMPLSATTPHRKAAETFADAGNPNNPAGRGASGNQSLLITIKPGARGSASDWSDYSPDVGDAPWEVVTNGRFVVESSSPGKVLLKQTHVFDPRKGELVGVGDVTASASEPTKVEWWKLDGYLPRPKKRPKKQTAALGEQLEFHARHNQKSHGRRGGRAAPPSGGTAYDLNEGDDAEVSNKVAASVERIDLPHGFTLSAGASSMSDQYGRMTTVRADVLDPDGNRVGHVAAQLDGDTRRIHLDEMKIAEDHQGKGIGSRLAAGMLAVGSGAGMEVATLRAVSDAEGATSDGVMNGAYTWARSGFGWTSSEPSSIVRALREKGTADAKTAADNLEAFNSPPTPSPQALATDHPKVMKGEYGHVEFMGGMHLKEIPALAASGEKRTAHKGHLEPVTVVGDDPETVHAWFKWASKTEDDDNPFAGEVIEARASLVAAVVAHGSHNQKAHGRRGGASVPSVDIPAGTSLEHTAYEHRIAAHEDRGALMPSRNGESGPGVYTTDQPDFSKQMRDADPGHKVTLKLKTAKPLTLLDRSTDEGEKAYRDAQSEARAAKRPLDQVLGEKGVDGVSYPGVVKGEREIVIHDPKNLEIVGRGEFSAVLAHGSHNQKTHGRRGGRAVGSGVAEARDAYLAKHGTESTDAAVADVERFAKEHDISTYDATKILSTSPESMVNLYQAKATAAQNLSAEEERVLGLYREAAGPPKEGMVRPGTPEHDKLMAGLTEAFPNARIRAYPDVDAARFQGIIDGANQYPKVVRDSITGITLGQDLSSASGEPYARYGTGAGQLDFGRFITDPHNAHTRKKNSGVLADGKGENSAFRGASSDREAAAAIAVHEMGHHMHYMAHPGNLSSVSAITANYVNDSRVPKIETTKYGATSPAETVAEAAAMTYLGKGTPATDGVVRGMMGLDPDVLRRS